ncbi:hypothetical protein I6J18_01225 [Peribacillus psychrosaccharolyticus]|uniref:Uncharacterized protein n=1 Tax=Peribacillus psychrosaccharolyticus TaxID=1407 RepID=A0A974NN41_PERPY|nr:hypothetical protein [Peribacillus psychrosaccharolyticus]MEC2056225.1 hypothetical protein [Peribacillus psychrosaccharolyticus]MED3743628.1 hypothetical protein [Peribacillus psychrosaccharolyticus]QQT00593.1 hypothetical protein I6J18_01225 [Peribacillus psychrosaccharolyticus]
MEISFINISEDYEEEVNFGIKTKEIPISIFEIKCEEIEEYHNIFRGVISILTDYSTRLITIISEPVPLKIPFHYNQTVLKGRKMIQTDFIDSSASGFLENYFSENEYRNSNDFLCIGEVQSWDIKSTPEFTPLSFIDLKGLFAFSEDLQIIQCVVFEAGFQTEFLAKLKDIKF